MLFFDQLGLLDARVPGQKCAVMQQGEACTALLFEIEHSMAQVGPDLLAGSHLELQGCQLLLGVGQLLLKSGHLVFDSLQLHLLFCQRCIAGIQGRLGCCQGLPLWLNNAVHCGIGVHCTHPKAQTHGCLGLLANLHQNSGMHNISTCQHERPNSE